MDTFRNVEEMMAAEREANKEIAKLRAENAFLKARKTRRVNVPELNYDMEGVRANSVSMLISAGGGWYNFLIAYDNVGDSSRKFCLAKFRKVSDGENITLIKKGSAFVLSSNAVKVLFDKGADFIKENTPPNS